MAKTRKGLIIAVAVLVLCILGFIAFSITQVNMERCIRINEVVTSNLSTLSDNSGGYPDWIELYNTSNKTVNLRGYTLREGDRAKDKYVFPDCEIEGNGYLLLRASSSYRETASGPDQDESFSLGKYIETGRGITEKKDEELKAPFSLSVKGTTLILSGKTGTTTDSVEIPELKYNVAFARKTDGTGEFDTLTATPGRSNAEGEEIDIPSVKAPGFSAESGFYDDAFELSITDDRDSVIYYTLDGSDPDESSPVYSGPIYVKDISDEPNLYSSDKNVSYVFRDKVKMETDYEATFTIPDSPVDKAFVVRAMSVGKDGSRSMTATKVYFVGYDKKTGYENIPVISLVTDPSNLFDYKKGIYVTGETMDNSERILSGKRAEAWTDANYRNRGVEWEREATMTCFDAEHQYEFSQQVGIRIKGNWSRAFPQKSLNIYARHEYSGRDEFDRVFFEGDKRERSVTLFSGGNDILYKMEDEIAADLAMGGSGTEGDTAGEALDFSVMRHYPCILFLDGEYWGLMELSEKFSKDYIVEHFGVNRENVVMIKNRKLEVGQSEDQRLYEDLKYLVYRGGFEKDENYKKFCEMVDIESFLDYYAFRIYIGNTNDWPARNYALWRVREKGEGEYEDGKWRYMLFDVNNSSMSTHTLDRDYIEFVREGDGIFNEVMKNRGFEELFYKRLSELAETNCSVENVTKAVDERISVIREPMIKWYERFNNNADFVYGLDEKAEDIKTFFTVRYDEYGKE
ncbi:MAG: CotH kinase family protein [Lachnospiraceae bacterium]|nr:CotH kinase family protein [Lachnospiraceae bacterium]